MAQLAETSNWNFLLDWAWIAVIALIAALWGVLQKRISSKASRESVDQLRDEMTKELETRLRLIDKLFTAVEDHAKEDHAFHMEVMKQMNTFHATAMEKLASMNVETFKELAKKADK